MTEFQTGDVVRFKRWPRNGLGNEICRSGEQTGKIKDAMKHEFVLDKFSDLNHDKRDHDAWDVNNIGPYGWGWVRSDDIELVEK